MKNIATIYFMTLLIVGVVIMYAVLIMYVGTYSAVMGCVLAIFTIPLLPIVTGLIMQRLRQRL